MDEWTGSVRLKIASPGGLPTTLLSPTLIDRLSKLDEEKAAYKAVIDEELELMIS